MNRVENLSKTKDEDFEWDPSETIVTAWSASNSTRGTRGRRAYGRRGSKNTNGGDNKNRRANQRRRRDSSRTALDEERAYLQTTDSYNSGEWSSTTSSNSSFDLTRSETLPLLPPPVGLHTRSKSIASAVPRRPPLLRHARSLSLRSESRSTSSSSAESRFGPSENMQPNIASPASLLSPQPPAELKKIDTTPSNIEIKGSAKRRKHRQHHPETDNNSGSSPSFTSPNETASNTFSRLAKTAELAVAWIKPSDLSSPSFKDSIGFDFGCFTGTNTASPTQSVATTGSSSRKRGVCELPFDDIEESSFHTGHSFVSSSSYETKSRSRSRIFSSGSLSKSITTAEDAPDPSDLFSRNAADVDSHDEKSPDEASSVKSDSSHDLSIDHAMQIEEKEPSQSEAIQNASLAPPKPVRRSSNDFHESVFGADTKMAAVVNPLDPAQIFEAMSDYEDLKFLIKTLRKEKHGSTIASFGTHKTWTVAPPAAWDSRRRAAFLQWASRALGFSLRAGGGAVAFLQTTVAKGGAILESLEAALIAHKAEKRNDIPNRPIPKNVAILSTTDTRSRPVAHQHTAEADGDVDMELLSGMESLNFANKKDDATGTVAAASTDSPLVRIVTLDHTVSGTSPHSNHQEAAECLSTTMDIVDSPHPPPRPSHEHHASGQDLMLHLHGLTPNPPAPPRLSHEHHTSSQDLMLHVQGLTPNPAPPRLSHEHHTSGQDLMLHLQGLTPNPAPPRLSHEHHASGQDLMLHLHGLSPNPSARPPALRMRRRSRPSTGRPSAVRTSNVPFDEDDGWETPSVKRADQFWGSGSRGGIDWGRSTRCPEEVISELLNRLEEAFKAAGCPLGSPFNGLDKITESASSSCFLPPSVASAAISSAALGFNDDDDSDKNEESDTFAAEEDNEDRFDELLSVSHGRNSSVGAAAFSGLNLNELSNDEFKLRRKRANSFAKHRRVSICAAVLPPVGFIPVRRQTTFVNNSAASRFSPRNSFQSRSSWHRPRFSSMIPAEAELSPVQVGCMDPNILSCIFSFFGERDLLCFASLVCSTWADAATASHACLMLTSMGFSTSLASADGYGEDNGLREASGSLVESVSRSMERNWKFLVSRFPWACYLSDGSYKKVFKVFNSSLNVTEALSVMDIERIDNKTAVAAELAVASMVSSLARRNICPNFIVTRSVFTCPYEPPASQWGSAENKKPRGRSFDPSQPLGRKPREPSDSKRGRFQYIRMELCKHGDAEEYIKRLPHEVMPQEESRSILFQIAFALHVAADRFSMKHYDVKLLNIFLQDAVKGDAMDSTGDVTVLRYGVGDHVFALRMPSDRAILAKLADYGTANVQAASNGKPVTIGQFTTIENTPPDYLIQGDGATQGHGHDNFGLGLCMLHLFTGHAPYEEILEDVFCPAALKKKLRQIWLEDEYAGFNAVRTMVLLDVDGDEGEPDETLYHTLYRYLVLFGIPEVQSRVNDGNKVWKAITQSLEGGGRTRAKTYGRSARQGKKEGPDSAQFARDRKKYSLSHGNNKYIARARRSLEMMEGGMELLLSLVNFDPQERATPLDVMNSAFMSSLREAPGEETEKSGENVLSFMSYAAR